MLCIFSGKEAASFHTRCSESKNHLLVLIFYSVLYVYKVYIDIQILYTYID